MQRLRPVTAKGRTHAVDSKPSLVPTTDAGPNGGFAPHCGRTISAPSIEILVSPKTDVPSPRDAVRPLNLPTGSNQGNPMRQARKGT